MRINEVKETREVVVRTEYVAEDEEVFSTKEECEKYEESAIFVVSKKLKRLHKKNVMHSDIFEECSCDCYVEIFNAETEVDVDNIRRYARLKGDTDLSRITPGHVWDYECEYCWTFGDGSLNALLDLIKSNVENIITPKESEEK
jgi:hypothetical protein